MAITIRPVTTKEERKTFVKLPFEIYKGNSNWVPPFIFDEMKLFDIKTNPSLGVNKAQWWLAFKDGKAVGRIAGIISTPYIEKWGKKHGRFGWIEFFDDPEVFSALMETVETWCRNQGMEKLVGPMGFTDLDKEAMLIDGFDELGTLAMIYNHAYYPRHMESRGYSKDADWVEYHVKVPQEGVPEKVRRVQELVFKRNKLKLVDAKKSKDLLPYVPELFQVLQDAYKELYGYVPLSHGQIEAATKQYFTFIDPRFTKVVLDGNNKVAAVGIAMPSLSRALQKAKGRLFPFGFIHVLNAMKHPQILDLYLVAVRPDLQNLGVNAILMNEITQNAIDAGITIAETNGELEDNQAVQSFWKHYDARQHKRRRVFIKTL